jgi:hypothetical protein
VTGILVGGVPSVVISVTGSRVRLADEEGGVRTVMAVELARPVLHGPHRPFPL